MNNRNFSRVSYSVGASVRYGSHVIMGITNNVSLSGICLKTDHQLPLNAPVLVTVYHSKYSSLKFDANVVWREENGVGLQINKLNVKSFVLLREIVAKHSLDQRTVMQETYKMLKCVY